MGLFFRSVVFTFLSISAFATHNALLPRPQHIQYGSGRFTLERAVVSLPANAASEDQFAAAELGRPRTVQLAVLETDLGSARIRPCAF